MNVAQWLESGSPDVFEFCERHGLRVMTFCDQLTAAGLDWQKPQARDTSKWRRGVQQTFTGRAFDFFDPNLDDITLDDISYHLHNKARFNGATNYTVAEHSLMVAYLTPEPYKLLALLHDASEAYGGDIPAPIKHRPEFAPYRDAEAKLTAMILEKFGAYVTAEGWQIVNDIDRRIVRHEALYFLNQDSASEWISRCGEPLMEQVEYCELLETLDGDTLYYAVRELGARV